MFCATSVHPEGTESIVVAALQPHNWNMMSPCTVPVGIVTEALNGVVSDETLIYVSVRGVKAIYTTPPPVNLLTTSNRFRFCSGARICISPAIHTSTGAFSGNPLSHVIVM
jgi:hypothetical protein